MTLNMLVGNIMKMVSSLELGSDTLKLLYNKTSLIANTNIKMKLIIRIKISLNAMINLGMDMITFTMIQMIVVGLENKKCLFVTFKMTN